jgi:hypothetical protein
MQKVSSASSSRRFEALLALIWFDQAAFGLSSDRQAMQIRRMRNGGSRGETGNSSARMSVPEKAAGVPGMH